MIISGNVIAQKMLADGVEVDDNVSVQLPSLERQTAELKGAGIMGSIDMPSTGQIAPMTTTINMRSISRKSSALARPGIQKIELRFVRDTMSPSGQMIPAGAKIYIDGVNKKYDPGKVENGSTMDGAIELETLRYRQVIDGQETLLIDKLNSIERINGVDYQAQVRNLLG